MKTSWFQNGNEYHYGEVSSQIDVLPVGIYNIKIQPMTGKIYLCKVDEDFKFNHKIYGLEKDFIQRVKTTYNSVKDNLGILLNGVKGSGKSVSAKLICNTLNLPVIVVDGKYDYLPTFISELQQNVVIFIDEYEKIYKENGDVLTVMDGIFKTAYKHVFLLTTNDLFINRNMLQRPGRIRYVKTYEDLTSEVVEEIIDDMLVNTSHKEDCIQSISNLGIITVDLVKSIIQEVNIHDEAPSKFIDFFNVKGSHADYTNTIPTDLVLVKEGVITKELFAENINLETFKDLREGNYIYHNQEYFGKIIQKYPNNMLKIGIGYNKVNKKSEKGDDYTEKVSSLDDYQENITVIDGVSYYTTQSSNPDLKVNVMVQMRPVAITHLNYRQSLLC
jgi:AAA+ ATPase superfamily predicted ATPase